MSFGRPSVNCSLKSGRFSNFKNSVSLETFSKLEHVNKHRIMADIVVTNRRLRQRPESSFRLKIAAKLRSGWPSEISGYMEKGRYWQMRARVHAERGMNNYPKSGFIWSTEDDAKRDLPLFVWYKSLRKAGDMKVPQINMGRKWFVDTCPDVSWDEIREMLSRANPVLTKTRNCSHVAFDSYTQEKRKVVRAAEKAKKLANKEGAKAENEDDDDDDDEMQEQIEEASSLQKYLEESNVTAMRKPFSELSSRRKSMVTKTLRTLFDNVWPMIAPGQDKKQKESCLIATFSFVDDDIRSDIQKVFDLAVQNKDEEQKTGVFSMFVLQEKMTRCKLSNIVGHEVTDNKYQAAQYHATKYSAGMEAERIVHRRNCQRKKEVVNKFVAYLIRNGLMTANARTIKKD